MVKKPDKPIKSGKPNDSIAPIEHNTPESFQTTITQIDKNTLYTVSTMSEDALKTYLIQASEHNGKPPNLRISEYKHQLMRCKHCYYGQDIPGSETTCSKFGLKVLDDQICDSYQGV